jgi:N-acetyl-gamma-glutamyl-phosphate reductase
MCEKRPKITFVPHLIPLNIGMLVTGYVILKRKEEEEKIRRLYDDFYSNAPFIRMRKEGGFPEVKDVVHTNFCDIGLKLSQDKRTLVVISAIDNLLKGASGQAIQNMNIMFGWSEEEGIW